MTPHDKIRILLIEDDSADVILTMEVFKSIGSPVEIHSVSEWDAALRYFEKNTCPDIILMDLNLPKRHGLEILREIRGGMHLKRVPVIILTTSDNQSDIDAAYEAGANCFLTKPVGLTEFMELARRLDEFWFKKAQWPSKP